MFKREEECLIFKEEESNDTFMYDIINDIADVVEKYKDNESDKLPLKEITFDLIYDKCKIKVSIVSKII